ncbi:MAG TPA: hypothetical protein VFS07_02785 [Gemmatimonadales bacterium]|jgi:hypothetical protein|nr:hypothetical protein [Gemmatimonadales bacterium]
MSEVRKHAPEELAEAKLADIRRAAESWAREAPAALRDSVRAVCVRLAEMVADQRHYLAPLPSAQENERAQMLSLLVKKLGAKQAIQGIEADLKALTDLELRATGSWSLIPSAQAEWITTATQFLEERARALPAAERPDAYWADDVVAGVIASVKAVIGVDELHARTESQFGGRPRQTSEQ